MEDKNENLINNIPDSNEPNSLHVQFDTSENPLDNKTFTLQEEKKTKEKVNEIEASLNSLNEILEKVVKNQGEKMDPEGWDTYTWNAEKVSPEELISPMQVRTRESMDIDESEESGEISFTPPKEGKDGILKVHRKEWDVNVELGVSSFDEKGFKDIKLNLDSAKKTNPIKLEEVTEFIKEVADGKHHMRTFGQSSPVTTPMPTPVIIYSQVPKSTSSGE